MGRRGPPKTKQPVDKAAFDRGVRPYRRRNATDDTPTQAAIVDDLTDENEFAILFSEPRHLANKLSDKRAEYVKAQGAAALLNMEFRFTVNESDKRFASKSVFPSECDTPLPLGSLVAFVGTGKQRFFVYAVTTNSAPSGLLQSWGHRSQDLELRFVAHWDMPPELCDLRRNCGHHEHEAFYLELWARWRGDSEES